MKWPGTGSVETVYKLVGCKKKIVFDKTTCKYHHLLLLSTRSKMDTLPVIERIKDTFYHGDSRTQSYLLEGEITISATGSCMNGLWTASGSDIDVVIVFHSRMAYN